MEVSDEMIFAARAMDEMLAPMISKGDLLMTKRIDRFDEAGLYVLRDGRICSVWCLAAGDKTMLVMSLDNDDRFSEPISPTDFSQLVAGKAVEVYLIEGNPQTNGQGRTDK